jgi:hypothetical protein
VDAVRHPPEAAALLIAKGQCGLPQFRILKRAPDVISCNAITLDRDSYFLTPRRYQSAETGQDSGMSRCGDVLPLRTML